MIHVEYPSYHPLSTVSRILDECECDVKTRTIGIELVEGSPAYVCQDCGGYVS